MQLEIGANIVTPNLRGTDCSVPGIYYIYQGGFYCLIFGNGADMMTAHDAMQHVLYF